MRTFTPNELLVDGRPLTQSEQRAETFDVDLISGVVRTTTISSCRRREPRLTHPCWCSYEMFNAVDEESAVIEQGEALMLNRSPEGVLLLIGHAPHLSQLIEVDMPDSSCSKWRRIVYVCETRWVRPVAVESHDSLYLVGCRRTFSPCRYVRF